MIGEGSITVERQVLGQTKAAPLTLKIALLILGSSLPLTKGAYAQPSSSLAVSPVSQYFTQDSFPSYYLDHIMTPALIDTTETRSKEIFGAVVGGVFGAVIMRSLACYFSDVECGTQAKSLVIGFGLGAILGAGIASGF